MWNTFSEKSGSHQWRRRVLSSQSLLLQQCQRKAWRIMLQRDGFPQLCESWRDHQTEEGHLSDIVDGQVWKDFQTVGDEPFLSAPWNYLFMLNFDFFRPIKHRNFFAELQLSPLLFPCCFLLLRWFFFLDSWPKRPQQSFFHNALTKPFQS